MLFGSARAGISGIWAESGCGLSSLVENETAEVCSSGWPWSCGPSHGFGRLSGWSEPWALSRSRTQARMAERVALPRRICLAMGLPRGFLRWICERYPCALSQSSFLDDRYPVSAQTAFELFVSSRTEESSCPS